jgi:hypothetical protein
MSYDHLNKNVIYRHMRNKNVIYRHMRRRMHVI